MHISLLNGLVYNTFETKYNIFQKVPICNMLKKEVRIRYACMDEK